MRAVIQRVLRAEVAIDGCLVGEIDRGLLVYVGVGVGDRQADVDTLVDKVVNLRIFPDAEGKMNLSVQDVRGGVLAVPNFTLLADARKGRRPAFVEAAPGEQAKELFRSVLMALGAVGCRMACGVFGTNMAIRSTADGPVNILYDTRD